MDRNDYDNAMVSVIIPVYQAEEYLSHCVESVVNQTYRKLEIILIDDGSTDNSLECCYEWKEKDERIRVLHHDNAGVAATRNRGLDCATGKYIYFLDSDDWIESNTLYDMVTILEKHDADIAVCGFIYVNEKDKRKVNIENHGLVSKQKFDSEYFWQLYENNILFNIGTKLYRRNIIVGDKLRFETEVSVYEDIRFCLEYINSCNKFYVCNEAYYYYNQRNGQSVTHTYDKNFWNDTITYCNLLTEKFDTDSEYLKKAVVLCLYRAYLQECRKVHKNPIYFCKWLERCCWPIVRRINLKKHTFSNLSLDQKIFGSLMLNRHWLILWLITFIVLFKNVFEGEQHWQS